MTHVVTNQPPLLEEYNLYAGNQALVEGLKREGGGWAEAQAKTIGKQLGTEQFRQWAYEANTYTPVLKTHDRFGHRIDEVEYHPAWHSLMQFAIENSLHSLPWKDPKPGAQVARTAMYSLYQQIEQGTCCPLSMTYSVVPALRLQPDVAAEWEPKVIADSYDFGLAPLDQKTGALCGMSMTEKQGGSDVRANTTTATAIGSGGPGAEYLINGHKWFCSAPMCDGFLILAYVEEGLSCFLVPRILPDGSRNTFLIQRLKDKLGNRSNASSEIELKDTWGRMIGEPGRGVPTIIEMVNHTRHDCVVGSTSIMREALSQALHHSAYRGAFGRLLNDQPLMQNVLADLCIESEAATTLMLRLSRSYDEAEAGDEEAANFKRIATAVAKYWVCKRAVTHTYESLECLGGAGYVEESGLPRLYRESPLLSIWEGSGNVICLDVLRALVKTPVVKDAFMNEVREGAGQNQLLDNQIKELEGELNNGDDIEARARVIVEKMALVLQGSLLVRYGDQVVAEAFCSSRLGNRHGFNYGTLPSGTNYKHIIERNQP